MIEKSQTWAQTLSFLWLFFEFSAMYLCYYGSSGAISVIQVDRSLCREMCPIVFYLYLCPFFSLHLYTATSDNVILYCSPLLATRHYQLWTHHSPLKTRSKRGGRSKKITGKLWKYWNCYMCSINELHRHEKGDAVFWKNNLLRLWEKWRVEV